MKKRLFELAKKTIVPHCMPHWLSDFMITIPRIVCGFLLAVDFGGSKFGMPWTDPEQNLGLFQVAEWFTKDVAAFGGIFAVAPYFFAWMGAASEAIGGFFLFLGFNTRVSAFFIMCTMLTAIFMQKWGGGVWGMLPAMGILWVSMYHLIIGSGRFGVDYILSKKFFRK